MTSNTSPPAESPPLPQRGEPAFAPAKPIGRAYRICRESACWTAVTAALAVTALMLLFTVYMPYDDEGYVLWSLKRVSEGKSLYTEIYSQYGPFFFGFYRLLGWLGHPFTTDSTRVVTGLCWIGTALCSALVVRRLTGSVRLALACHVCTFIALWKCCREPGHPGGFLALLTAFGAWLGVSLIERQKLNAFAVVQGALGAAMGLSKINIGLFHLVATASWWPFARPAALGIAARRWILSLTTATAGLLLMQGLLNQPSIRIYFGVFLAGAGSMILARPTQPLAPAPGRFFLLVGIGGIAVLTLSLGAAWLEGSTLDDLIHYTFVAPVRHPGVYFHLFQWSREVVVLTSVSIVSCIVWLVGGKRAQTGVLITLKTLAAVLLGRVCWNAAYSGIENSWFEFGPAFAWALAIPLGEKSAPNRHARWWLAWLFCWHWLQAYPVAGTQIAWAAFLALPLVFVGIDDLVRMVGLPVLRNLPLGLAIIALCSVGQHTLHRWKTSVPLDFPGARNLRLEAGYVSTYHLLADNVRANGDVLFTYPGMISLNLWFEMPPPGDVHATHWFSLLTDSQQKDIIERLRQATAPLVIVQRDNIRLLMETGLGPQGPLKDYLHANFRPVLRLLGYDIWARSDRPFTPVSVARIVEIEDAKGLLLLTRADPSRVNSITLESLNTMHSPPVVLAHKEGWREIPLPDGHQPASPGAPRVWRLFIPLRDLSPWQAGETSEIKVLDANGSTLDRLRMDASPMPASAFSVAPPPPAN